MVVPAPFISVVVPTYARPAALRTCLAGLARLDYPRDRFEVVVIDDGSPSPVEEVVAPFRQQCDVKFQRQSQKGPGSARNLGLACAKGDFVAFTDDDCTPAPDWLQQLATRFAQYPDSGVGGRIVNALPDNPFSNSTALLIAYLYDYYNRPPDKAQFFTSNNLAFPTRHLRAIGGFEPSFLTGEDRELCERWRSAGHGLVYAPDAVIHHAQLLDLTGFFRLHFRYGWGSSRFRHRSAQRQSSALNVEPFSFYVNLVRYPFTQGGGDRALLLSGLLALAQLANAAGFLYQSLITRHGDPTAV